MHSSGKSQRCPDMYALLIALPYAAFMHSAPGTRFQALHPSAFLVPKLSEQQNEKSKHLKTAALIRMQCQPFSLLRGARLLAAAMRSPRRCDRLQRLKNAEISL